MCGKGTGERKLFCVGNWGGIYMGEWLHIFGAEHYVYPFANWERKR